jgi:hypothetical protein
MNDWQYRVVLEKQELDTKLENLCVFSNTNTFAKLPLMEQERMNTQRHLMCALSSVLGARISHFKDD